MKYCKKCGAMVRGINRLCPLCFSQLTVLDNAKEEACYPDIQASSGKTGFMKKLFLFLSISLSLTCLTANLLYWRGLLWSLIVVTGLLLIWETVGLMILSRKNVGLKLITQTIAVLIALIVIDAVTGWNQWSIGIVAPFVIIAATCAMTIVLYIKRMKWREYMLYQLVIAINGFIPVILALCGITKIFWPGAVGAIYSLLTFIGMLIFAEKQFKSELKKRFHV